MVNLEDTTYYRFLSEVRAFLSKLIKDPIKAEPSKYLKDREVTRSKLIKDLMSRDVLERHEKILDSTNSEEKTAKYVVKYKVKKKDFENKIRKIYIKYFEKNEPDKVNESVFANEEEMKEKILNSKDGKVYKERGGLKECDCGGCMAGGADLGGTSEAEVGSETSRGDVGYDTVMGMVNRPGYNANRKKKKNEPKPENILGKTIAEGKKPRRIFITEEQFDELMETTCTASVGSMGNYTAQGLVLTTKDGKPDPCYANGKIKVKTVMKEGLEAIRIVGTNRFDANDTVNIEEIIKARGNYKLKFKPMISDGWIINLILGDKKYFTTLTNAELEDLENKYGELHNAMNTYM